MNDHEDGYGGYADAMNDYAKLAEGLRREYEAESLALRQRIAELEAEVYRLQKWCRLIES